MDKGYFHKLTVNVGSRNVNTNSPKFDLEKEAEELLKKVISGEVKVLFSKDVMATPLVLCDLNGNPVIVKYNE